MTTFSIDSILSDQNGKHQVAAAEEKEDNNSIEEQNRFLSNNISAQDLFNIFCKNVAITAGLNEQHHNKTNLIRSFPLRTNSSSSNDYYSLHKLNTTSYQGNHEIFSKYLNIPLCQT